MINYDVIVAGGGVAGATAAIEARRHNKSVLLIEKSVILGGLATLGLINLFVPMCNGRGKRIMYGMVDEMIKLSVKYGWDTTPEEWRGGEPATPDTKTRYMVAYSPNIFALSLTEALVDAGVEILFDAMVTGVLTDGSKCRGVAIEDKRGRVEYAGSVIIDATGDADVLRRAGVPTLEGENFFTYIAKGTDIEHCARAAKTGKIEDSFFNVMGGPANLYGGGHPEGMKKFSVTDVSDFVVKNQLELLRAIKTLNKAGFDIATLPGMAQLRTTRRIDGDYTLREADVYSHFEDSIFAMNDFDHRDFLYEVPYRTLIKSGFDNIITAGRSAAAEGYAWDCLRVIPPAILSGQAAGAAAAQSIETGRPIWDIDVSKLQETLAGERMMLHFDDSLRPVGIDCEGEYVLNNHV